MPRIVVIPGAPLHFHANLEERQDILQAWTSKMTKIMDPVLPILSILGYVGLYKDSVGLNSDAVVSRAPGV